MSENQQHPIEGVMETAMRNLKEMVDVNTVVGDAITTPDGTVIIPVSKVNMGFASGGSDFTTKHTSETNRRRQRSRCYHFACCLFGRNPSRRRFHATG